jgi:hypothetical protein
MERHPFMFNGDIVAVLATKDGIRYRGAELTPSQVDWLFMYLSGIVALRQFNASEIDVLRKVSEMLRPFVSEGALLLAAKISSALGYAKNDKGALQKFSDGFEPLADIVRKEMGDDDFNDIGKILK